MICSGNEYWNVRSDQILRHLFIAPAQDMQSEPEELCIARWLFGFEQSKHDDLNA
jgi:hypothetical protein